VDDRIVVVLVLLLQMHHVVIQIIGLDRVRCRCRCKEFRKTNKDGTILPQGVRLLQRLNRFKITFHRKVQRRLFGFLCLNVFGDAKRFSFKFVFLSPRRVNADATSCSKLKRLWPLSGTRQQTEIKITKTYRRTFIDRTPQGDLV
jgi:hypothetical protein